MNGLKTALLLGTLSGLLLLGGEMIGGRNGLYTALAIAVAMNFVGYFFSDKLALAMYSAQPVTPLKTARSTREFLPSSRVSPNVWDCRCRSCG